MNGIEYERWLVSYFLIALQCPLGFLDAFFRNTKLKLRKGVDYSMILGYAYEAVWNRYKASLVRNPQHFSFQNGVGEVWLQWTAYPRNRGEHILMAYDDDGRLLRASQRIIHVNGGLDIELNFSTDQREYRLTLRTNRWRHQIDAIVALLPAGESEQINSISSDEG
jgi:hypothetical protein